MSINQTTLDHEALEASAYLGGMINRQGEFGEYFKEQIGKARTTFLRVENILYSKRLSSTTQVKILAQTLKQICWLDLKVEKLPTVSPKMYRYL